jgi:hypothetical protein
MVPLLDLLLPGGLPNEVLLLRFNWPLSKGCRKRGGGLDCPLLVVEEDVLGNSLAIVLVNVTRLFKVGISTKDAAAISIPFLKYAKSGSGFDSAVVSSLPGKLIAMLR